MFLSYYQRAAVKVSSSFNCQVTKQLPLSFSVFHVVVFCFLFFLKSDVRSLHVNCELIYQDIIVLCWLKYCNKIILKVLLCVSFWHFLFLCVCLLNVLLVMRELCSVPSFCAIIWLVWLVDCFKPVRHRRALLSVMSLHPDTISPLLAHFHCGLMQ